MSDKRKDRIHLVPVGDESDSHIGVRDRGDGNLELGSFRTARTGEAMSEGSELICVGEREGDTDWYDVTASYRHSNGPAQVATPAYRAGYDRIFGKQKVGEA